MRNSMGEETVAEIEAEQSMLVRSIEEAKQLSARSDVLMDAARGKLSGQPDGDADVA